MRLTGPGIVYAAPIPRCPTHGGQLRWSDERNLYVCHGWDGEGCGYWLTSDEIIRTMRPIGTLANGNGGH